MNNRSRNLLSRMSVLVVLLCGGGPWLYGQNPPLQDMLRNSKVWLGDQYLELEIPLKRTSELPDFCEILAKEGATFENDLTPNQQVGLAQLMNNEGDRIGYCPIVAGSPSQAYIDCNRNGPTEDDPSIQRVNSSRLMLSGFSGVFPEGLPEGCIRATAWAGPSFPGASGMPITSGELDLSLRYNGMTETVRKVVNRKTLPLVASGPLGELGINSSLVFSNTNPFPVDLRYNFWNNNQATSFKVGGSVRSQGFYHLDPYETLRQNVELPDGQFQSAGVTYEATSGKGIERVDAGITWITVKLETPFSKSPSINGEAVRFPFQNGTTLLGEAGLATPTISSFQVVSVERIGNEGRDTSLAIFNPTSVTAFLTLSLVRNGGVVSQKEVVLNPRTNLIGFFWELLGLQPPDFAGTLQISSSADVGVISLSTLNGIQQSSLPAGAN